MRLQKRAEALEWKVSSKEFRVLYQSLEDPNIFEDQQTGERFTHEQIAKLDDVLFVVVYEDEKEVQDEGHR